MSSSTAFSQGSQSRQLHTHPKPKPVVLCSGTDGIDPITHHQVPHTTIDFDSTLWCYENCRWIKDRPPTVILAKRFGPCFMYTTLKLSPGLHIFTVKSKPRKPTCQIEIIQREKNCNEYDSDNGNSNNNQIPRHVIGKQACTSSVPRPDQYGQKVQADFRFLAREDTDVEIRIIFASSMYVARRIVPTFESLEVRSRRCVAMPMKACIPAGFYKPKPIQYNAMDLRKMLKRIHYMINWLHALDDHINSVLRLVTNPLWDIDEPTNAYDYTHAMQNVQNALSTEIPHAFVGNSRCFAIFLMPGVRVPLLSQSMVTELIGCINQDPVDTKVLVSVLRNGLKYMNTMVVEYTEFSNILTKKIASHVCKKRSLWNTVHIDT